MSSTGAHAKAMLREWLSMRPDVDMKSRVLTTHYWPSQPLQASQTPFTSLTFHGDIYFPPVSPVRSFLLSFLLALGRLIV